MIRARRNIVKRIARNSLAHWRSRFRHRDCTAQAGEMLMRLAKILGILLMVGILAAGAQKAPQSEGKKYLKQTFSPAAAGKAGLGAAVTQATNTPSEWGQGASGFGERLGSAFGKHLVQRGIQYPVSKMFHEQLGYQRSGQKGFGPRLKHALVATVITHKTTTGKRTVAKGQLAGAFGSGLVSRLWQPASTRTVGLGFASGGITLGVDAAGNVIREFWPEIRHPHAHQRVETREQRRVPKSSTAAAEQSHRTARG